jgi:hypothetical protein
VKVGIIIWIIHAFGIIDDLRPFGYCYCGGLALVKFQSGIIPNALYCNLTSATTSLEIVSEKQGLVSNATIRFIQKDYYKRQPRISY